MGYPALHAPLPFNFGEPSSAHHPVVPRQPVSGYNYWDVQLPPIYNHWRSTAGGSSTFAQPTPLATATNAPQRTELFHFLPAQQQPPLRLAAAAAAAAQKQPAPGIHGARLPFPRSSIMTECAHTTRACFFPHTQCQ